MFTTRLPIQHAATAIAYHPLLTRRTYANERETDSFAAIIREEKLAEKKRVKSEKLEGTKLEPGKFEFGSKFRDIKKVAIAALPFEHMPEEWEEGTVILECDPQCHCQRK